MRMFMWDKGEVPGGIDLRKEELQETSTSYRMFLKQKLVVSRSFFILPGRMGIMYWAIDMKMVLH